MVRWVSTRTRQRGGVTLHLSGRLEMTWFLNCKTGVKLAIGFGACLLFSTIQGTIAVTRMASMNQTMQQALGDAVVGLHSLAKINADARRFRTLEYEGVLTDDP